MEIPLFRGIDPNRLSLFKTQIVNIKFFLPLINIPVKEKKRRRQNSIYCGRLWL